MPKELPDLNIISQPRAKETFIGDLNTVADIPEETLTSILSRIRDEEYSGQSRVHSQEVSKELDLDETDFDRTAYLVLWLSNEVVKGDTEREAIDEDIEKLDPFLKPSATDKLKVILDYIEDEEFKSRFKRAQGAKNAIQTGPPRIKGLYPTINKRAINVDGELEDTIIVVELTFELVDGRGNEKLVYAQTTPDQLDHMIGILGGAKEDASQV